MKKLISLTLISALLSGCSFFRPHKMDIEQGNIIAPEAVKELHRGMSEAEVKDILGPPMLTNIFTPNRVEYVYTYQPGYGPRTEKRLSCLFNRGALVECRNNPA